MLTRYSQQLPPHGSRLSFFFLLVASLLVLNGCSQTEKIEERPQNQDRTKTEPNKKKSLKEESSSETPVKKTPVKKTPEERPVTSSDENIEVSIASWEEAQKFVAGQKGKIVVLDIWSTSCLPCLREYPHLVALQKKYPKRVVCVSFNVDYYGAENEPPESSRENVMKVLSRHQSQLKNFISSTADEDLYQKIDLASIPVVFVYSTDGKLKKRFDNETLKKGDQEFSYKNDIVPMVENLLREAGKRKP